MSGRSVLADDEEEELFDSEEEMDDDSEDQSETENPPRSAQAQSDWENRFKGLQGTLQQQVEHNRQLQAQMLMTQAGQAQQQLIAQGVDPAVASEQVRAQLAQYIMQQQGQQTAVKERDLEQAARIVTAQALAIEYGIDTKSKEFTRLSQVKDAEDMQAFAEQISQGRTTANKKVAQAKRRASESDKFGSGRTSGSAPKNQPKSLGDAADRFAKLKIEM